MDNETILGTWTDVLDDHRTASVDMFFTLEQAISDFLKKLDPALTVGQVLEAIR